MSLTIYKRGEIWHYRGTVAGRRLRGSTETSDEARARRIASEKETQAWQGKLDGPASVLTFAQAALLYLDARRSTAYVAKVSAYWKDTPVSRINAGTVRAAALAMLPDAKNSTRNRQVIATTQAIINYAAEMELCSHLKVKRFKVATKRKQPVTWPWVTAFMKVSSPELGAMCCFMYLTGARISETLDIRWSDIDRMNKRAAIRQTKVYDERRAHLPPVLIDIINALPEGKPDDRVFGYHDRSLAKRHWRVACKEAGIKYLSFHSCRHGFATGLLHKGYDPITVAKLGGWKSPQHLFLTYGHAMADETLANALVDTNLTQPDTENEIDEQ